MRATASTLVNSDSSRSHAILTLTLDRRPVMAETLDELKSISKQSHFYFVDLAGSERIKKTGATGQLLQEAKFIGSSLSTLCLCMRSLQHNEKRIPYRNSQLTRVLKNCLKGSDLFALILTISINNLEVDETVTSLRFGVSCMNMRVQQQASDFTGTELTERVIRELNDKSRSLNDAISEINALKISNSDLMREKNELALRVKAQDKQLKAFQRRLDECSNEIEDLKQMQQYRIARLELNEHRRALEFEQMEWLENQRLEMEAEKESYRSGLYGQLSENYM